MEQEQLHILKKEANSYIRGVGALGLCVVVFSLWSATVRLPATRLRLDTGITPLIGVEMPRSKADLENILGQPGSENRRIIAGRSAVLGLDFVPGWSLFLFGLYKLISRYRPELDFMTTWIMVLLIVTMCLEYAVFVRIAAVANEASITDQMVHTISVLSRLKWSLLFFNTMQVGLLFLHTPRVLRLGGSIMWYSSAAGMLAVGSSSYQWLAGPAVLGLFVGLCGVTVLFLFHPQLLYEDITR